MPTLSRTFALLVGLGLCLGLALPAEAANYYTIEPCRAVDSRQTGGTLGSAEERNIRVRGGSCGVPSNASAVVMSLSVIGNGGATTHAGRFAVWDSGFAVPREGGFPIPATLNWSAGISVLTHGVTVPFTSGSGFMTIFGGFGPGATPVHFTVDIFGYYR